MKDEFKLEKGDTSGMLRASATVRRSGSRMGAR